MVEQVVTVAQAHIPALLLISPSKDVWCSSNVRYEYCHPTDAGREYLAHCSCRGRLCRGLSGGCSPQACPHTGKSPASSHSGSLSWTPVWPRWPQWRCPCPGGRRQEAGGRRPRCGRWWAAPLSLSGGWEAGQTSHLLSPSPRPRALARSWRCPGPPTPPSIGPCSASAWDPPWSRSGSYGGSWGDDCLWRTSHTSGRWTASPCCELARVSSGHFE